MTHALEFHGPASESEHDGSHLHAPLRSAGRFSAGIDQEMEQRRREWLLDVEVKHVKEAAERVAEVVASSEGASVAVLGRDFADVVKGEEGWRVQEMGGVSGDV